MSKRGRRRSSRRRKSSSSSKQSVSPYIFQKLNKNNVSYKDDIVEKGETDSLRKENAPSGSEDEEKYDNAPPKEKRFKQDYPNNSVPLEKNVHARAGEEKGVSIVTSVSLGHVDDCAPKIVFQQSHGSVPEDLANMTAPVTNVLKINCSATNVKLEIRETFQLSSSGFKTTFVLMDNSGEEIFFKSECERTWSSNNEQGTQSGSGTYRTRTPSSPPLLFNSRPPGKRKSSEQSVSSDQFWDVPPPQEFADVQYRTVDVLSDELASCTIGLQRPADEEHEYRPAFLEQSRSPFSVQTEDRADLSASFDRLSESDNYEPMFMRPSFSTNRSSFTKHFISSQKRRSWIRNNSIATVERRSCPVPRKRRQTFPGPSQGPEPMQDDFPLPYSESFSSLFTCSLPFQTEKFSRIHKGDDAFSTFGLGSCISSQTKETFKADSEFLNSFGGNQSLLSPFYVSSSEETPEDGFSVQEVCAGLSSGTLQDSNFKQSENSQSPDTDDCEYKVEQRDFIDSGFDQEIAEVEYLTDAVSPRSLAIQITPPSCSGSEEQMMPSHPVLLFCAARDADDRQLPPERRKTSVTTITGADCQHRSTTSHSHSVPTLTDVDANRAEEEPAREKTESDASFVPMMENDVPTDTKQSDENDAVTAENPAGSSEKSSGGPRDRHLVFRPPVENKEHLRPVSHKEQDVSSGSDHWAKRRKMFKESKQWSSAGGSSFTSDITEESEETRSTDVTDPDDEDRGFYTETFHSSAWIYHGDDVSPDTIHSSRTRAASIRDRTVRISKGTGEYPWGFRIQFSKPIVVTEVDTNGAAEEAGLMVGDYVLAVNGIDVTSIPHSEAADLARQGPDDLTLTIGSDIARGPNTPRPACRGYLHKRTQSGLIKGWRKRWFVLKHDCCLHYYRHKRDEGKRKALSVVKLEGAEVGPDASLGKPFVFKCRPLAGSRVFFFCATSNQEMKRWLEAMQKAVLPVTQNHVWVDVTRHNSNLPPLAVKNPDCLGLLHKMDRTRDVWLQHYCILKDGCLYMYSGIRATHAHGGIYLQGYMVREQPHGSKKSTIELKPPSDEFRTFYLCAENPAENKRWIVAIRASIKKWLHLHQALQDYMNRSPEETRM